MSSEIIQFYLDSEPIVFPRMIPGKDKFELQKINVICFKCEKPTTDNRGTCTNHTNCTDFLIAGHCEPCKAVTQSRFRVYSDGRLLFQQDDTWKTYKFKTVFSFKGLLRQLGITS
jgi:hypothetical protein